MVVSNAGPLIALARIGHLALLPELYGEIAIPPAVRREIVEQGKDRPGATLVESASWIQIVPVQNTVAIDLLRERLDVGESEAIVLALESKADLLIMDEERGRRVAVSRGLELIGTLGTIVLAKRRGLVEEVEPLLISLVRAGFRISDFLYRHVLEMTKE